MAASMIGPRPMPLLIAPGPKVGKSSSIGGSGGCAGGALCGCGGGGADPMVGVTDLGMLAGCDGGCVSLPKAKKLLPGLVAGDRGAWSRALAARTRHLEGRTGRTGSEAIAGS
mmetsp:Transcript_55365/g.118760  ORF Transcript_55365/g.118760 Transcript_55365/m.118760 type:complete len:113 (-) Transcript_55365:339-677(-)